MATKGRLEPRAARAFALALRGVAVTRCTLPPVSGTARAMSGKGVTTAALPKVHPDRGPDADWENEHVHHLCPQHPCRTRGDHGVLDSCPCRRAPGTLRTGVTI